MMRRASSRQRNHRIRAGVTSLVLVAVAMTVVWKALLVDDPTIPAVLNRDRIVFTKQTPTDLSPVIAVMQPDGSGVELLGPGMEPKWSPDGKRIAFIRSIGDGRSGIFVMDADGTHLRRLTTNPSGLDENPSWSPGGGSIVFSRSTFVTTAPDPVATRARRDLYTVRSDGTGITKLLGGPTDDFAPEWSPDGTRLGFVRMVDPAGQGRQSLPQVWTLGVDGSEAAQLTHLEQGPSRFDWSPDASALIVDAVCAILFVDVDTGEATRLRFERKVMCPWDPAWSPDGARITFTAGPDDDHDIYVSNADGTGVIRLTGPAGHDSEAAWWGAEAGSPEPT